MAYVPHRPSILQRPLREGGGKANQERREVEYEKEQLRIAAKAQRQASSEERLVRAFYSTEAEKRSAWESTEQERQQLLAARQAAQAQEAQREAAWLAQPQQVYVDTSRPWSANSTTYYISREQEDEARRRAEREAAEANRRAVLERSFQQQQERSAEREAIRSTMQSEDAWFNRGAASERWIPPERRIKQRAAVVPQFAVAPPPYFCDAEEGARQDAEAAAPRRNPFWERESGQGAKSAMSHDVYLQNEAAGAPASRRPATAAALSPAPSARSQQAGQQQQRQQSGKYPWSWDA